MDFTVCCYSTRGIGPHLSKVRTPNFQRTPKTTVTLRFFNMDVGHIGNYVFFLWLLDMSI